MLTEEYWLLIMAHQLDVPYKYYIFIKSIILNYTVRYL